MHGFGSQWYSESQLQWWPYTNTGRPEIIYGFNTGSPLKFMPPGHFCPDVCGIEDFGEADTWRGRTVRAFFRIMKYWPKPKAT